MGEAKLIFSLRLTKFSLVCYTFYAPGGWVLFLSSSMAEQSAVNRPVGGSSPPWEACYGVWSCMTAHRFFLPPLTTPAVCATWMRALLFVVTDNDAGGDGNAPQVPSVDEDG